MLLRTRPRQEATPLVCADVRSLSFPDQSFGAVITSAVLTHVHPDTVGQALAETLRIGTHAICLLRSGRTLRALMRKLTGLVLSDATRRLVLARSILAF